MTNTPDPSALLWHVFCRVIDNHGDLGVCWRLSAELVRRGHRVHLWVDDARALAWMAPQGLPGLAVHAWNEQTTWQAGQADRAMPTVWLEAFGCDIEHEFIANSPYPSIDENKINHGTLAWINLEYLSAEAYVERCHGLPSPVMQGPGKGLTKVFFYPGFTRGTGGLLRECELTQRQASFDRTAWLSDQGIDWRGERLISLFCYEPAALPMALRAWAECPYLLLVTPGRAAAAMRQVLATTALPETLRIHWLDPLTQTDFDHLLWASDLNCVRGEDSLVRALWAGKPLLWHIYPQDDGAHQAKLEAFLSHLNAPADLRLWHRAWNAPFTTQHPKPARSAPTAQPLEPTLPPLDWTSAQAWVALARASLMAQPDLITQLLAQVESVAKRGATALPVKMRD